MFFDEDTVAAMREYWIVRKFASADDPVFAMHGKKAGKKHKPITTRTVWDAVDEARTISGIEPGKFWPHALRHNYAKTMLRATNNLALVQDLLGHASPVTTRKYTKIEPEELREAHHKVFDKEAK